MTKRLTISDIADSLEFIGEALSGGDYVSASEMTDYGNRLLELSGVMKGMEND